VKGEGGARAEKKACWIYARDNNLGKGEAREKQWQFKRSQKKLESGYGKRGGERGKGRMNTLATTHERKALWA